MCTVLPSIFRDGVYSVIQLAETDESLKRCCRVLVQLRTAITEPELLLRVKSQMRSGYRLAYIAVDDVVVSVAGFRFGENLAWGKYLYIDDFVSDKNKRGHGHGACLFQDLLEYAKERACDTVHLDSGVQRFSAHKFYLREGLKIASHHFSMRLEPEFFDAP